MGKEQGWLIFGTGRGGKRAFYKLRERYSLAAFADNDKTRQGGSFCGLPVIAPEEIEGYVPRGIVIASVYYHEIGIQLVKMGFKNIYYIDESFLLKPYEDEHYKYSGKPAGGKRLKKVLFVQYAVCIRTFKISSILRDAGIQVDLAYLNMGPETVFQNQKLPWTRVYPIVDLNEFMDFVNTSDYDVIHHSNEPDALADLLLHSNKKVVHDVHDMMSFRDEMNLNTTVQEYIVNRYSHGIIYSADGMREMALDLFHNEHKKTIVVENRMYCKNQIIKRLPKLSAADHEIHCVYEGGVSANPKSGRFYEGRFLKLAEQGIHVHYYTKQGCGYIERLHPNIHYEGSRNYEELLGEMTRYDAGLSMYNINRWNFKLASCFSANKPYDYLAAGIPVAVADVAHVARFIEEYKAGGGFDWDEDLKGQLSQIAKIRIPENFLQANGLTMENYTEELIGFYEKVAFDD